MANGFGQMLQNPLMMTGMRMLEAAGPQVKGTTSFGSRLGQAGLGAMADYQNLLNQQMQRKTRETAMKQIEDQIKQADRERKFFQTLAEEAPKEGGMSQQDIGMALLRSDVPDLQRQGLGMLMPQPEGLGQQFTLKPGEIRFAPTGEVIATGGKAPEDVSKAFEQATKMRKEFTGQSKDFVQVRDSYQRIIASAQDPSAAGDLALIFNYMKMLDPGSVVRESEFATAENAAGVPAQVRARWNKVLAGERLAPSTRADFTDRASKLFERQKAGQTSLEDEYKRLAKQQDIDPTNVIIDYSRGLDLTMPTQPPIPEGFEVIE